MRSPFRRSNSKTKVGNGMPRSPNRPKFKLRDTGDFRARLMDVDFEAPREILLGAALSARLSSPAVTQLPRMTLAARHWLIAQLLLGDGTRSLDVAEVCSRCGELLELRLDLDAAVRDAEI